MELPADSHVHSEWSWDTGGPGSAAAGRMQLSCERAVRIGLSTVIFTEHLDFDDHWQTDARDLPDHLRPLLDADGVLRAPLLDVDGYLDAVDRCRHRFPELTILTGVEYGQPHLWDDRARRHLDLAALDRVNGSLHTLADSDVRCEPNTLFRRWPADRVITEYLAEVPRMATGSDSYAVFTHIDYAIRAWPTVELGPFDPRRFEGEFRQAMRSLASTERALELNTERLWPWIPQWWAEEGGRAVTFGSDAHVPESLAENFGEATAMAEHFGFGPGRRAKDFWTR